MQTTPLLDQYDAEKMAQFLGQVPLFGWIVDNDFQQFRRLLSHCRLFRLKPGETIIHKGDVNQWVYVVLKGACFAYNDSADQSPINELKHHDLFGEVAAILKTPRIASIVANYSESETLLVGMDFSIFELEHPALDVPVKLLVWKAIQRVLFKRLSALTRDLKDFDEWVDVLPTKVIPADNLSDLERVNELQNNCREAALPLQQLSERLAFFLN